MWRRRNKHIQDRKKHRGIFHLVGQEDGGRKGTEHCENSGSRSATWFGLMGQWNQPNHFGSPIV